MTTLSYRKHYPAGAARATATRHLLAVLRRAPTRRARWHQQVQRRRPWLLRPLTPGEKNLLGYRGLAQELAGLLAPFRLTRLRGHYELNGLLTDTDTRPTVVVQVQALRACLDRVSAEYVRQDTNLTRWRQEWNRNEATQRRLIEQEKALAINEYHGGLYLLIAEAQADIKRVEALCPEAFAPTQAAPAPVAAPPYSA